MSVKGSGIGIIAQNRRQHAGQFAGHKAPAHGDGRENRIRVEGACRQIHHDVERDDGDGDELEADDLQRGGIVKGDEHRVSACLAGNPQHVAGGARIGPAAGDEEEVRQPVDIGDGALAHMLALMQAKLDDEALGAAADGAGQVEVSGGGMAAGQHEGAQRRELAN